MKKMRFLTAMLLLAIVFIGFNACSDDEKEDKRATWGNEIAEMFNNTTIESIDYVEKGITKIKFRDLSDVPSEIDFLDIEKSETYGFPDDVTVYIPERVYIIGNTFRVRIQLSNSWINEDVYFEVIDKNTLKSNGYIYKRR